MRILTEAEYERRLEQARMKGYEEAAEKIRRDQFENDFREDLWRAIRETRGDFDRAFMNTKRRLDEAGIPDPFEPPTCDGPCAAGTVVGTAPDGSPVAYTGR